MIAATSVSGCGRLARRRACSMTLARWKARPATSRSSCRTPRQASPTCCASGCSLLATLRCPAGTHLAEGVLLITGTGRRLREAAARPERVLCALAFDANSAGATCRLHAAQNSGVRPTSELDSHLGIHAAVLGDTPGIHAVIHAQPRNLTYLSHIPAYREPARLNRALRRWQPETSVMAPEGVALLPFITPGTPEQGVATASAMRDSRVVVWAKHGVVARSSAGPLAAADLIEYLEAAAAYETLDLLAGQPADGLSAEETRAIARRFGVPAPEA